MLYVVVFIFGMVVGLVFASAHYKDEMIKVRRQAYIDWLRDEENGLG